MSNEQTPDNSESSSQQEQERKARHQQRMERKKAVVDAGIAKAQEERGIVIVITGNGKGKTTSAFGTLFRALGYGHQVGLVQFIKGTRETGEVNFLKAQAPQVRYHAMATGFTWETQNWDKDKAAADEAWSHAVPMLQDETLNLVVLDELTYMFKNNYLDIEPVVEAIRQRPAHQSVIITGRGPKPELLELADTVSEIKDEKHAYRAGVKAQAGIDF